MICKKCGREYEISPVGRRNRSFVTKYEPMQAEMCSDCWISERRNYSVGENVWFIRNIRTPRFLMEDDIVYGKISERDSRNDGSVYFGLVDLRGCKIDKYVSDDDFVFLNRDDAVRYVKIINSSKESLFRKQLENAKQEVERLENLLKDNG